MIEKIINSIIAELGATGLLIMAFAIIHHTATKKVIAKMDFLNDELSQIIGLLQDQNQSQNQDTGYNQKSILSGTKKQRKAKRLK